PTATVPDERYQWVLAHLFTERDSRFNVGPGSEFLRLLAAFQAMGVSVNRIAELHDAVISWVERSGQTPFMQLDRLVLDEASIAAAALSFTAISQRVGKVPFVRSQLALAPLVTALRGIGQADAVPPEVRTLAVHTFAMAGRLAFELHDDQHAR